VLLFSTVLALGGAWAISRTREPQLSARGGSPQAVKGPSARAPIWIIGVLAVGAMLQTSTVGVNKTFFNVYLDDHLGLSTASIGGVFAGVQLISAVAAGIMPQLTKRWGLHAVFVASSLAQALSILPLALIPTWGAALVGRSAVSAFASIHSPATSMVQVDAVEPRWRSAMIGAVSTAKQLSWMSIAIAGGYVIASMGYRTLFVGTMVLSMVGTAILWGYVRVRGEAGR
jgi:predicted MFS family arabinose efflux permease